MGIIDEYNRLARIKKEHEELEAKRRQEEEEAKKKLRAQWDQYGSEIESYFWGIMPDFLENIQKLFSCQINYEKFFREPDEYQPDFLLLKFIWTDPKIRDWDYEHHIIMLHFFLINNDVWVSINDHNSEHLKFALKDVDFKKKIENHIANVLLSGGFRAYAPNDEW